MCQRRARARTQKRVDGTRIGWPCSRIRASRHRGTENPGTAHGTFERYQASAPMSPKVVVATPFAAALDGEPGSRQLVDDERQREFLDGRRVETEQPVELGRARRRLLGQEHTAGPQDPAHLVGDEGLVTIDDEVEYPGPKGQPAALVLDDPAVPGRRCRRRPRPAPRRCRAAAGAPRRPGRWGPSSRWRPHASSGPTRSATLRRRCPCRAWSCPVRPARRPWPRGTMGAARASAGRRAA